MGGIQTDKVLRINLKNFLSLHISTFILMLGGFAILYSLRFEIHFVKAFLVVWALDLLPASYLYITYLSENKYEEYEIRETELIRRKGGEERVYTNDEIEKIIVYLSPALYNNSNFHLLMIEGYHYAVVKLKTGEELILTCLLSPRLDKSLKQMRGVLFEKRKRLFCIYA